MRRLLSGRNVPMHRRPVRGQRGPVQRPWLGFVRVRARVPVQRPARGVRALQHGGSGRGRRAVAGNRPLPGHGPASLRRDLLRLQRGVHCVSMRAARLHDPFTRDPWRERLLRPWLFGGLLVDGRPGVRRLGLCLRRCTRGCPTAVLWGRGQRVLEQPGRALLHAREHVRRREWAASVLLSWRLHRVAGGVLPYGPLQRRVLPHGDRLYRRDVLRSRKPVRGQLLPPRRRLRLGRLLCEPQRPLRLKCLLPARLGLPPIRHLLLGHALRHLWVLHRSATMRQRRVFDPCTTATARRRLYGLRRRAGLRRVWRGRLGQRLLPAVFLGPNMRLGTLRAHRRRWIGRLRRLEDGFGGVRVKDRKRVFGGRRRRRRRSPSVVWPPSKAARGVFLVRARVSSNRETVICVRRCFKMREKLT